MDRLPVSSTPSTISSSAAMSAASPKAGIRIGTTPEKRDAARIAKSDAAWLGRLAGP
jgi:hypothetical protein